MRPRIRKNLVASSNEALIKMHRNYLKDEHNKNKKYFEQFEGAILASIADKKKNLIWTKSKLGVEYLIDGQQVIVKMFGKTMTMGIAEAHTHGII